MNQGGQRLGGSTTTTTTTTTTSTSTPQQMARRVPMSCCSGAACGSGSAEGALAGVAAPFLVSVATGADGLGRPLDLAYWLGLQDSYSTKAPLTLKAVVALIRSLEGRDKVTKVCSLGDGMDATHRDLVRKRTTHNSPLPLLVSHRPSSTPAASCGGTT